MTKPIVVAHRGLHQAYPENSLAAFRAACDAGIKWCECDVQLSSDGELVVIHDETLDRTTDGTGAVADFSGHALRERRLKNLDGSVSDHRLPKLKELLHEMPQGCSLLLEVKPDLSRERLSAVLNRLGEHVVVQSFHRAVAEEAATISAETAWLTDKPINFSDLPKCKGFNLRHDLLDENARSELRSRGYSVGVWTPNSDAHLQRAIALEVDVLITDEPQLAMRLIQEASAAGLRDPGDT
jgi:glycerophosphoryl diester phosphodiesterase